MEEDKRAKNFEIKGGSKKKVVKFGSKSSHVERKVQKTAVQTENVSANDSAKVNDSFAKHSQREPLKEGEYPRELKHQFSLNSNFEEAFEKLEQSKKLGYLFYFSGPKLTASITNRIVKKIDRIIAGHGLTDCTCGKSKSLPNCDGSHKVA